MGSLQQWWFHLSEGQQQVLLAVVALVAGPAVWFARRLGRPLAAYALPAAGFGSQWRRYRRWFDLEHGMLRNIYLDREEKLSLANTYVPLSAAREGAEERIPAAEILTHPDLKHLIILGDPGTGKSTLLRAFGTSLTARSKDTASDTLRPVREHVPFFVPLRALARFLMENHPPAQYALQQFLIGDICQRRAKIRNGDSFVAALLRSGRCLVLLDGLDEVPQDQYVGVREAILAFANAHDVRIALSCRRQNFLEMRLDWIPALSNRPYTLAPLQEEEVKAFIERRRPDMADGRSPEDLFHSIQASGTMDLHRVPLILTISIGLYVNLIGYKVPTSLVEFYDEMIKELLTRHDFRLDETGPANRYSWNDKLRFLKDFAFEMAARPDQFEDFSHVDLVECVERLRDCLPSLDTGNPGQFIQEIIHRSGMITKNADAGYVFSHRSIQEYLVARKLLADPEDGMEFLLTRAKDSQWRQVCILFASLDHGFVVHYLRRLERLDVQLCGYCLGASKSVERRFAERVLKQLASGYTRGSRRDNEIDNLEARPLFLASLMAVTRSPLPWLRSLAIETIAWQLRRLDRSEDLEIVGLDRDALVQIIDALWRLADAVDLDETICSVVGKLSTYIHNDVRALAALWGLLPSMINSGVDDGADAVMHTLVAICSSPKALAALDALPPYPGRIDDAVRCRAYPFRRARPPESNGVTLLALFLQEQVSPRGTNSLVRAMVVGGAHYASLERAHHSRQGAVTLFLPARTGFLLAHLLTAALIVRSALDSSVPETSSVLACPAAAALCASFIYHLDVGPVHHRIHAMAPRIRAMAPRLLPALLLATDPTHHPRPDYSFTALRKPDQEQKRSKSLPERWFTLAPEGPTSPANPMPDLVNRLCEGLRRGGGLYGDHDSVTLMIVCCALSVPVAALGTLAFPHAWTGAFATSILTCGLFFWVPATKLCQKGFAVFVRSPNPLLDVYEDPKSTCWLKPSRTGPTTSDPSASASPSTTAHELNP